jgi:deazaflavin-dependent oxidoreductase (nitroreductase family)
LTVDAKLANEDYCYVTTTGRVTGKPHEVEIWFGLDGDTLYILSGGREKSDWVKNAKKTPAVRVRIAGQRFEGQARIVTAKDEDALARRLLLEKYTPPRYSGGLSGWGKSALPVAIELQKQGTAATGGRGRS